MEDDGIHDRVIYSICQIWSSIGCIQGPDKRNADPQSQDNPRACPYLEHDHASNETCTTNPLYLNGSFISIVLNIKLDCAFAAFIEASDGESTKTHFSCRKRQANCLPCPFSSAAQCIRSNRPFTKKGDPHPKSHSLLFQTDQMGSTPFWHLLDENEKNMDIQITGYTDQW